MNFWNRWYQESSRDLNSSEPEPDGLEPILDRPQQVIAVSFLVALLSFALGIRYAGASQPAHVLANDKDRALIVVYGDHWIFRPVKESSSEDKSHASNLFILSGSAVENIILEPITKTK